MSASPLALAYTVKTNDGTCEHNKKLLPLSGEEF